ncbi:YitT family protein [Catonella massiliensis]|uniref:YitT family protein n=2 Tax=Catonella massiliensis TaxID=2799636 RepID=A0ABS1J1I0_9FIRM|nr:YitT family protein [Catonella massiliensis]
MNMKSKLRCYIRDMAVITFATFIVAVAVFFFMMPNNLAIASIAGLAVVLQKFIPLSVATISLIFNVGLLIIGFIFVGREFGGKTVYTSVILPIFVGIFEKLFPKYNGLTGDPFLDMICYIFIVSIGLSLLFNHNASSGGLDIIVKILNKYLHIDKGKAMSIAGMLVSLSAIFAYDTKTVVLSVLGTYLNGIILDYFLFGTNIKKKVCILSRKNEEIKKYILKNMHSGATLYKVIGAYNNEEHEEVVAIVNKREYGVLMQFIRRTDPDAFVTVSTINEVMYKPKC